MSPAAPPARARPFRPEPWRFQVNPISVGASASRFLAAYPADLAKRPTVSQLNAGPPTRVAANGTMMTLSKDGESELFNRAGTTDIIIDVFGVMSPGAPGDPGGPEGPQGFDRSVRSAG